MPVKKDVIYIDVEDDITAIIGKVKAASSRIIALVPPKRIGVIQSSVNLKLVKRAAEQVDKRLVIITGNRSLMALTASIGIPIAKNLQSKPEIAEIAALSLDDGDDVIDGETSNKVESGDDLTADSDLPEDFESELKQSVPVAAVSEGVRTKQPKVPNFDRFRKKLVLIIAAVVLLVGAGVWAFVFAPKAEITITANTVGTPLMTTVSLGDTLSTSLRDGTIKAVSKSIDKEVSRDGEATGEKNIGERATGKIALSNSSFDPVTIKAGTKFEDEDGNLFTLDSATTIPAGHCASTNNCTDGSASATVTASEPGAAYNGISGVLYSVVTGVSSQFSSSTSGGTDKVVKVVTDDDVAKVTDDSVSDKDINEARADITKQFGDKYVVIRDSFSQTVGDSTPNPAVGAETTDGKFSLVTKVTFSMIAVSNSELNKFLDSYFNQQIDGKTNQKIYSNGLKSVTFTSVTKSREGYTASLSTNGKIGPKIDENSLKDYAKGKKIGEIRDYISRINGVDRVDVSLSPFWVRTAPNNVDKISVEFEVDD